MKQTKILVSLAAGAMLASLAQAQTEVVITGSTAFRSITQDRIENYVLMPGWILVKATNASGVELRTYTGTLTNTGAGGLNGTAGTVRTSFTGSAQGMIDVKQGNQIPCAGPTTGTIVNRTPDIALSDVFPGSATPPLKDSDFDSRVKVGVVPFLFAVNNNLANGGVTNITRDQALLVMTATGSMPDTFLGGTTGDVIYLCGRDSGSGTRISTEKDIGFIGAPVLWDKLGGTWVTTNGYASGSKVAAALAIADTIGYIGLGDFSTVSNSAKALTYNGVPYSSATVTTGSYGIWGYEHAVARSGISAPQKTIFTTLTTGMKDNGYQSTNVNYVGKFENINLMNVERAGDGGVITSLNF